MQYYYTLWFQYLIEEVVSNMHRHKNITLKNKILSVLLETKSLIMLPIMFHCHEQHSYQSMHAPPSSQGFGS